LVLFTGAVDNLHIWLIGGQFFSPSSLTLGEVLLSEEKLEAVMICVEGKVLATFKVVPEGLDSMDDGQ
jgi:hypothetical protein